MNDKYAFDEWNKMSRASRINFAEEINEAIKKVLPLVHSCSDETEAFRRIHGIDALLEANEYGVAFEILCENLFDYECKISEEAFRIVKEIGSRLKSDENYWKRLEPYIIL